MQAQDADPLFGPPQPKRIELRRAPLTGVLAQLRFAEIFSIQKRDFIASFQEEIRRTYPLTEEEQALSVQVGVGNAPALKNTSIWKFSDAEKIWTVTLAPDFLALETKRYTDRADFRHRLRTILDALASTIRPTVVTRAGVRYVNRIVAPEMDRLRELLKPEIGSFSSSELRPRIRHSLTEALCETAEGMLLLRWGLMAAGASHDVGLLPPISARSWMFDLDSFREFEDTPAPFDPDRLSELIFSLATRVNTFFYWAASPKLIETFDGVS